VLQSHQKPDCLLLRGLYAKAYEPKRGCFKAIKKLACSEVATFLFCFFIYLGLLANAREPKGGSFKAIKKLACSEVATFLFCFFPVIKASFPTVLKAKKPDYLLLRGLLANAREPKRGCFKAIKKLACSEVATFLFCFFIYLGLLANAREPWGGRFKTSKSQIIYYFKDYSLTLVNPRGGASKPLKS
jgi:hypothetical protein